MPPRLYHQLSHCSYFSILYFHSTFPLFWLQFFSLFPVDFLHSGPDGQISSWPVWIPVMTTKSNTFHDFSQERALHIRKKSPKQLQNTPWMPAEKSPTYPQKEPYIQVMMSKSNTFHKSFRKRPSYRQKEPYISAKYSLHTWVCNSLFAIKSPTYPQKEPYVPVIMSKSHEFFQKCPSYPQKQPYISSKYALHIQVFISLYNKEPFVSAKRALHILKNSPTCPHHMPYIPKYVTLSFQ